MAPDAARRQGTLGGIPLKHISLLTLTLQNALLVLAMHYSRVMPTNGQRYYTSTAVFLNELVKLAISLSMALYDIATNPTTPEATTAAGLWSQLGRAVFTSDSWKLAIPAMLYTVQNSLQYIGVSHLDAATFQVTYQLKILTTALFSVTILGQSLSLRKWLALVLLAVGAAIVSIPAGSSGEAAVLSVKDLNNGVAFHSPRKIWDLKALGNAAAGQLSKRSATYQGIDEDVRSTTPELNASVGLVTVVIACVLSGLAGVYFEKVLKEAKAEAHTTSVWVRNVQLSFYSIWPALFLGVFFRDGEHIAKTGFFVGYNSIVWLAIILQAFGGVLVALVVNYADDMAKEFATSASIIIILMASVMFLDFQITPSYAIGTGVVLVATYMYNTEPEDRPRPPPIYVSDEKSSEASYFDLESIASAARSPLRGEALSTSRPSTPSFERRPKPRSPGVFVGKREV
ncbi:UDP-galactose transporter Gms1 [Teratosphaeriaceae sp. CCFEE 6253]|nr:UDP-galactose transporter Gms1 [Teratosphaeriaceae sp. CCFEE 6253]